MSLNIETSVLKRQIVAGLVGNGLAHADAVTVADVGLHAACEAALTIQRVTDPLTPELWVNAYSVALTTALEMIGGMEDLFRKNMLERNLAPKPFFAGTTQ